jgi:hypothetical protein
LFIGIGRGRVSIIGKMRAIAFQLLMILHYLIVILGTGWNKFGWIGGHWLESQVFTLSWRYKMFILMIYTSYCLKMDFLV